MNPSTTGPIPSSAAGLNTGLNQSLTHDEAKTGK